MKQEKSFSFNLPDFKKQFQRRRLPLRGLVPEIGSGFLGAPYQAATLESGRKEKLIVNFAQFDCFTFVETVLALAKCVAAGKISLPEFRRQLQFMRYRHGIIDGYSSRLHYFTDWLHDSFQKKIMQDLSAELAAVPHRKKINYLTAQRQFHHALQEEQELQKMLLLEKNISRRILRIIPTDEVNRQKGKIKNGDLIAFAVAQDGLDVGHVGFALWQEKKLHFLHASSREKGVVISALTLVNYLRQNKKFTGIMAARLNQ